MNLYAKILTDALVGNIVPDFPLCNKSFNLSYSAGVQMWKMLATTVGLTFVVSVGLGGKSQEGSSGAISGDGRAVFLTYCTSCHGTSARGDGPVADGLRVRPADLTRLTKKTNGVFIAARIQRIIEGRDRDVKAHGNIEMPVWGDAFKRRDGLSEEAVKARIEAIVRYLQPVQERSS